MSNVLLVDDDKICNFLNEKVIHQLGFARQISKASNGKEAIEWLQAENTHLPDVIFLDLNMPIMNGFQFMEAFGEMDIPNKENITIVVVTSSIDPRDVQKASNMGVNHYLQKPISAHDIKTVLHLA